MIKVVFAGSFATRIAEPVRAQLSLPCEVITGDEAAIIPQLADVDVLVSMGFTAAAFLVLIRAMVADVADEVRLEQGQDNNSLLFSMVTTMTKVGLSITTVFSFSILAMVGYKPGEAS